MLFIVDLPAILAAVPEGSMPLLPSGGSFLFAFRQHLLYCLSGLFWLCSYLLSWVHPYILLLAVGFVLGMLATVWWLPRLLSSLSPSLYVVDVQAFVPVQTRSVSVDAAVKVISVSVDANADADTDASTDTETDTDTETVFASAVAPSAAVCLDPPEPPKPAATLAFPAEWDALLEPPKPAATLIISDEQDALLEPADPSATLALAAPLVVEVPSNPATPAKLGAPMEPADGPVVDMPTVLKSKDVPTAEQPAYKTASQRRRSRRCAKRGCRGGARHKKDDSLL